MAFLVEKGPGAITRPHFHQADQFQVVVAGRGMLGDHEFSDGAAPMPTRPMDQSSPEVRHLWVRSAQSLGPRRPVYAGRAEVLNAARDRHQHWELATEAMPAALL